MSSALLILGFALLGLAIGSFLNLCIDRLPLDQSIIHPPSHCPACGRRLAALDLIPIFSYLWLRGHCRYCRAPIPPRLPLVEGATALLFAFLYWHYGLSPQFFFSLVYASLFIIIFVIDLEHQLILDKVVYPGMGLALIFSPFWPELGIVKALLGGVTGFVIMLLLFLIFRGGLGMGDVKLMGLVGLATGFPHIDLEQQLILNKVIYPGVVLAFLLSVIAGGLVAAFLLLSGLKRRREAIPFGPFLVLGALATLIWGSTLWEWYINLL